ncbi:DgyrCDS14229 [Dimorphilus gyrociliatus]|uniref:Phosphoserine phosphatase n=1 Tax=Dimorphilus gyrociliatus TaxID=2664684 RepID=A0A7I8WD76_9ANNE|nr:DgyrCDS14229 [Dimorphilus gyrociliatus]
MDQVIETFKKADCVCFDVDSTVCTDEGADELAAFMGVGEQVANLTNQAMGGSMTFRESLEKRLDIMKPDRSTLQKFVTSRPPSLTSGIKELVKRLQDKQVVVYLVSGGFKTIIEPVADSLLIPRENIIANEFIFNDDGSYKDFDRNAPTSASGGKCRVIEQLKASYSTIVHIGDGVTDMEASPPADAFIGFGGNKVREAVKKESKWFVMSFDELLKVL